MIQFWRDTLAAASSGAGCGLSVIVMIEMPAFFVPAFFTFALSLGVIGCVLMLLVKGGK